MASVTSTARSISQVSRESLRIELQGSIQTVFPIHRCMAPTANSETQDYGTLGNDGPLEGATKVFQITLRDLSEGHGGLHRINAYFYDNWADKHCRLTPGETVAVSGPAASLVRSDVSASSGDHPFCLVFHTPDDDMGDLHGTSVDEVKCEVIERRSAGGTAVGEDESVAGRFGRSCSGNGAKRGAGTRRGDDAVDGPKYVYTKLASLQFSDARANVYGIVCSFNHPHQSRGKDMTISVSILDESRADSDSAVPCNFFHSARDGLPVPIMVGDIIRIHRAKLQVYRDRPQLLGIQGVSWLLIRKKKDARQAFQRWLPGEGTGQDGGRNVEDLEPDEESPPSGPDAGGGNADSMLPSTEWEVQASSVNYTLSQVDQDRCKALHAWLVGKGPHLWLKPSAEPKTWVRDVFRRPMSGPVISETEIELVCCLLSKHEKNIGGAGSLNVVYVADGTGFANSPAGGELCGRRDAALTKGMRYALGIPDWSPRDQRPPPYPAHLKVEIVANNREWEALALSPGMWVRLRRLTVLKNRETATMSALMRDPGSSVNPLHPAMAEVQAIAKSYDAHCGKINSRRNGSGNNDISKMSRSTVAPCPDNPRPSAPAPEASGERETVAQTHATHLPAVQSSLQASGEGGGEESHILNAANSGASNGAANGGIAYDGAKQGSDSGRSSKRSRFMPQPTRNFSEERSGREQEVGGSASAGGASDISVSHLGTVRRTPAPSEFDTRVKIVSHFPPQVRDFVRQGPQSGGDLNYLFSLRLEDDHGVVDALVSGRNASCLLPGLPSPSAFRDSESIREKVEETLVSLESKGAVAVPLRLRSYVKTMPGGSRGTASTGSSLCKRFSIIAPSSLEGN